MVATGFLCFLLLATWAETAAPDGTGDKNAAIWYEQAASLFEQPTGGLVHELAEVVSNGWRGEHPGLRSFLSRNEPALETFRKGTSLEYCDFLKGGPPPTGAQILETEAIRYPETLTKIVESLIAQGRWYEAERDVTSAIANYLAILRAAHHLGQEPHTTLLGKLLEMAVFAKVYVPLSQLVENSTLPGHVWRRALFELDWIQSRNVGMERAFQAEPLSTLDVVVRELWERQGVITPITRGRVEQILTHLDRLTDEYYAYLLDAYRKRRPEVYQDKVDELLREVQTYRQPSGVLREGLSDFPRLISGDLSAEVIAKILVATTSVGYAGPMTRYFTMQARANLLRTAVAIRLYEIDRGELPGAVAKLVPDYLAAIPEDPFGDDEPVKYLCEAGSCNLWSVGPDRQDQGGQRPLALGQYDAPGDVVLALRATVK